MDTSICHTWVSPSVSVRAANVACLLVRMVMVVSKTLVNLYIYQSLCHALFGPSSECLKPDEEKQVAREAALFILLQKVVLNLPPFILTPFFGGWTDKIGRKMPAAVAMFGNMLGILLYMLSNLFRPPSLLVLLSGSLLRGLFGKSAFILTALQSYVIDMCSSEKRTSGLSAIHGLGLMGFSGGLLGAGMLLTITSFDIIFCVLTGIMTFCVFLVISCLYDCKTSIKAKAQQNNKKNKPGVKCFTGPFASMFKEREGRSRQHLLMLLLLTFLFQTNRVGEEDVLLLYLQRASFGARPEMYAYVVGVSYATQGLVLVFLVPVFTNVLEIRNATMILVALFVKMCSLVLLTFSDRLWMVFSGVILGVPSAMFVTISKSMMSSLVGPEEVGTIFGVISSLEIFSSITGSAIYINLYVITSSILPGMVFSIEAGVCFIMFLLSITFYKPATVEYKRLKSNEIYRTQNRIYGSTTK